LGISTIIKSTPPAVPCTPLKARALLNLYYTLQTTFRMKFITKLEIIHHEALNWQEKMHTILRKAFISTHSLRKALCCMKYESVDSRDPEKKNT
jgi:hypothetical protein